MPPNYDRNGAAARITAQDAIDTRSDKYEHPETGLKSVLQEVKAAVASQFGRGSSQYAIMAGIRY